jgi:ribonuclease-3
MWLAETLSYEFADPRLLNQALTHRSCPGENNERLEFLGDAVLDLVVSDLIFHARQMSAEGELSRQRAALVNKSSLAELASEPGLGDFLVLGEGERKTGGHRRESILADALEALFGAVYLDAGFAAATEVIQRAFGARMTNLPADEELRDPKTRLQEWLQARAFDLPEYELVKTSGKAHRQLFEVRCSIRGGELSTSGHGTSRRNAEQESAEKMLSLLHADDAG